MKTVLLPIREPWASMICDGDKKLEFRTWVPSWPKGTKVFIIATGIAKKPREVIGSFLYGGTIKSSDVLKRITVQQALQWGFEPNKPTNGIILNNTKKYKKPYLMSEFGVSRTPMSWQWSNKLPIKKIVSYE